MTPVGPRNKSKAPPHRDQISAAISEQFGWQPADPPEAKAPRSPDKGR